MEKQRSHKITFSVLAIGFTLLSAWNGMDFYRMMFGMYLSITITSVFETSRLVCLFRMVRSGKLKELLSVPLYVVIALVCAFASINSFNARIIQQNMVEEKELDAQVQEIKKAFAAQIKEELAPVSRDITWSENQISKAQQNDYWKRRREQFLTNRDEIIRSRDLFLGEDPEDKERWIKANSARLGIDTKALTQETDEIRSVRLALKDMWGLTKLTSQKLVGVIVTFVIELSIILMAFLSDRDPRHAGRKINRAAKRKTISKARSPEDRIEKFVANYRDYFRNNGTLPPLRKISPSLRPIRRQIENLEREELRKLFEKGN